MNCLLEAFATVLCRPTHEMVTLLGHDGNAICWPTLPEPMCRRGYSIDEMIEVCDMLGYAVTPFRLHPEHRPTPSAQPLNPLPHADKVVKRIIETSRGVITGTNARGVGHAAAYDHGFTCENFKPLIVWRVDALQPRTENKHDKDQAV